VRLIPEYVTPPIDEQVLGDTMANWATRRGLEGSVAKRVPRQDFLHSCRLVRDKHPNLAETSVVRASWKLPRGLVFRYRIIWKISPSGRVTAPCGEVTQPCGKGTQPLRLIFQIIPTVVLITIRGFFAAGPKVFEPSSDSLSSSPIYRIDYNKKTAIMQDTPRWE
jgi:hypothetical protein